MNVSIYQDASIWSAARPKLLWTGNLPCIPRIGEQLYLQGRVLRVLDVVYDIYTESDSPDPDEPCITVHCE